MSESESTWDAMFLDEEDELYGYGILNVHNKAFVSPLGGGPRGTDCDLFSEPAKAIEYFKELQDELDSVRHLRIVQVRLDNNLDKQASEPTN